MKHIETIIQTTQALAANPQDAAACKLRAITLCKMQQYDKALQDLDTLIDTLHTQDAEVYQLRGTLRMNMGDKKGALADLRHAFSLDPQLLTQLTGEFQL